MGAFILLSAFAAIGVIVNAFRGSAGVESLLAWLVVLLIAGAIAAVTWRVGRRGTEFMSWLRENESLVLSRGAEYEGLLVTAETELVRYWICCSLVLVSTRETPGVWIKSRDPCLLIAIGYSTITFVFGWWGIPWGPIWTLRALARNICGGDEFTVEQFLAYFKRREQHQSEG